MKKAWKIIGVIAGIIVLVLAGLLYWSTWQGNTKEIESVANEFKSDPNWTQVSNQVVPPMNICLEANCPSVHRSWKTGANLTKNEFQAILYKSNWVFDIEGDCKPQSNVHSSNGQSLCSASGIRNGYLIRVVVAGNYEDNSNGRVTLFIDEQDEG